MGRCDDEDKAILFTRVYQMVLCAGRNPYGISGHHLFGFPGYQHLSPSREDEVDFFHRVHMSFERFPWSKACYGQESDLLQGPAVKDHLCNGAAMGQIGTC